MQNKIKFIRHTGSDIHRNSIGLSVSVSQRITDHVIAIICFNPDCMM